MLVKCRWLATRQVVANPDGQVLPCCYFANRLYITNKLNPKNQTGMLASYNEDAANLNIFNKDIGEILSHKWFDSLVESFTDEEKVSPICLKHCAINKEDHTTGV